ncbi:hypothetical protein JZU46_01035 [bacterium]|jgi:hypothetical protein|nr:hypothetical protein [bacterium]
MFVNEFCRQGGILAAAQLVADQVKRIEGLAPGDFAVIAKNRASLSEPRTALEFMTLLRNAVDSKAAGQRQDELLKFFDPKDGEMALAIGPNRTSNL